MYQHRKHEWLSYSVAASGFQGVSTLRLIHPLFLVSPVFWCICLQESFHACFPYGSIPRPRFSKPHGYIIELHRTCVPPPPPGDFLFLNIVFSGLWTVEWGVWDLNSGTGKKWHRDLQRWAKKYPFRPNRKALLPGSLKRAGGGGFIFHFPATVKIPEGLTIASWHHLEVPKRSSIWFRSQQERNSWTGGERCTFPPCISKMTLEMFLKFSPNFFSLADVLKHPFLVFTMEPMSQAFSILRFLVPNSVQNIVNAVCSGLHAFL